MKNKIQEAIGTLIEELKTDEGYRESWKANISMAFKDDYYWYKNNYDKNHLNSDDIHIIANTAADNFLKQLCR